MKQYDKLEKFGFVAVGICIAVFINISWVIGLIQGEYVTIGAWGLYAFANIITFIFIVFMVRKDIKERQEISSLRQESKNIRNASAKLK